MPDFDRVRQSDWSALLRIAAEVADVPTSAARRREHILTSCCALIGARMASVFDAVADVDQPQPDGVAAAGSLTTVHTSPAEHATLHRFVTSPTSGVADPVGAALTRAVLTRGHVLRPEFADDRAWERSDYFNNLMRTLRLGDQLSCRVDLPGGGWAGMCLLRDDGDRPFDERDRQVMALFHRHAAHLYAVPRPALATHLASLPPRLRPVLQGLLDGDAEKQVAAKLDLSRHTVHEYVKQLYRRYGVTSRGELFAHLRSA